MLRLAQEVLKIAHMGINKRHGARFPKETTMKKILLVATTLYSLTLAGVATAGVTVGVAVGIPGVVAAPYYPAPVMIAPAPPVYYAPPVVVVPPVVVRPPVVYAPGPVVYTPVPVVVRGGPVYYGGYGPGYKPYYRGNGHGHGPYPGPYYGPR